MRVLVYEKDETVHAATRELTAEVGVLVLIRQTIIK